MPFRKGQLLKSRLTEEQILAWADAHHKRTGRWPFQGSGRIVGAKGEYWHRIDNALRIGHRGLKRGGSLLRLLTRHRGAEKEGTKPKLTQKQVIAWADAHYRRTRRWPRKTTGRVVGTAGETWEGIDCALRLGSRGLTGDTTLFQLLKKHRGMRNENDGIPLNEKLILKWCDKYFRLHGRWPGGRRDDDVPDAPWERWRRVDNALRYGLRGLEGGSSIALLLNQRRGVPYRNDLPKLSHALILRWADAYHHRHGVWPQSGPEVIPEASRYETWAGINASLIVGRRGLKGGDSLARLLQRRRGVKLKSRRLGRRKN